MKIVKIMAACLAAITVFSVYGEDVLTAYTNASWVLPHWRKFNSMDEYLSINGWVSIITKRSFAVDPEAVYEISGMFRTPAGQAKLTYFDLGFSPVDADGRVIDGTAVLCKQDSLTVLAEDVKAGAKSVKIKKAPNWFNNGFIAFNAREDLSDLPNRENVWFRKPQVQGEFIILPLVKPLKKGYAAGTKVRCHGQGALWTVCHGYQAPKEWTKFSGKIKGMAKAGGKNNMWWPGTERAKVFILVQVKSTLEFKDVAVRKISE